MRLSRRDPSLAPTHHREPTALHPRRNGHAIADARPVRCARRLLSAGRSHAPPRRPSPGHHRRRVDGHGVFRSLRRGPDARRWPRLPHVAGLVREAGAARSRATHSSGHVKALCHRASLGRRAPTHVATVGMHRLSGGVPDGSARGPRDHLRLRLLQPPASAHARRSVHGQPDRLDGLLPGQPQRTRHGRALFLASIGA